MAEDSAEDYFKEDYSALITEIAAEAGREAALKAIEEKQQQAHTLTEQEEQELAKIANHALAVKNAKEAIASLKGLTVLFFASLSLILLVNAGFLYFINKKSNDYYDNFYKAKYDKALAEYIEQSKVGAAWSMTESGIEAQALDKKGLIQAFTHCRLKGFVMKKEHGKLACMSDKNGGGWWLPD